MTPYELLTKLFHIPRSLTGPGVREALFVINTELDDLLTIQEVPSGTRAYDWVVPPEWRFKLARMKRKDTGDVVFDTSKGDSPLHVVGYSACTDTALWLEDNDPHIHVGPREMPNAIPYVTTYYADPPMWGICLSHNQYEALDPKAEYAIEIVSEFLGPGEWPDSLRANGSLTYAEAVIPGDTTDEIVLSSYICHTGGMANNECSGPAVLTEIVKWWRSQPRRYTLRILLAPETIGPLVWMSQQKGPESWTGLDWLKAHVKAGFTLTCMGGGGTGYVQQGRHPTYASRIAKAALAMGDASKRVLKWRSRMSDERQWCAPGIDLPWATIMKTHPKDPEYEYRYHTSADDLTYVTEKQITESVIAVKGVLEAVELDRVWRTRVLGEPQLGKRGLYDTISKTGSSAPSRSLLDVLSYCDGCSMLEIAETLKRSFSSVQADIDRLREFKLIPVSRIFLPQKGVVKS
jgi:aminopeptidase-like protein